MVRIKWGKIGTILVTAAICGSLLLVNGCGGNSPSAPPPATSPAPKSPAPAVNPTPSPKPPANPASPQPAPANPNPAPAPVNPNPVSGTGLTLTASAPSVKVGDSFTLDVVVASDISTGGAQCALSFDPALLQCDGVVEGDFYSKWAESNGGFTMLFPEPVIDNKAGHITIAAVSKMNAEGGPKGSGTFLTYQFTAKAAGTAELKMSDSYVVSPVGDVIEKVTVENAQIVINK